MLHLHEKSKSAKDSTCFGHSIDDDHTDSHELDFGTARPLSAACLDITSFVRAHVLEGKGSPIFLVDLPLIEYKLQFLAKECEKFSRKITWTSFDPVKVTLRNRMIAWYAELFDCLESNAYTSFQVSSLSLLESATNVANWRTDSLTPSQIATLKCVLECRELSSEFLFATQQLQDLCYALSRNNINKSGKNNQKGANRKSDYEESVQDETKKYMKTDEPNGESTMLPEVECLSAAEVANCETNNKSQDSCVDCENSPINKTASVCAHPNSVGELSSSSSSCSAKQPECTMEDEKEADDKRMIVTESIHQMEVTVIAAATLCIKTRDGHASILKSFDGRVSAFVSHVSGGRFSLSDVFERELHILKGSNFDVLVPCVSDYLKTSMKVLFKSIPLGLYLPNMFSLSSFIARISLLDPLIHGNISPAAIAVSACLLAVSVASQAAHEVESLTDWQSATIIPLKVISSRLSPQNDANQITSESDPFANEESKEFAYNHATKVLRTWLRTLHPYRSKLIENSRTLLQFGDKLFHLRETQFFSSCTNTIMRLLRLWVACLPPEFTPINLARNENIGAGHDVPHLFLPIETHTAISVAFGKFATACEGGVALLSPPTVLQVCKSLSPQGMEETLMHDFYFPTPGKSVYPSSESKNQIVVPCHVSKFPNSEPCQRIPVPPRSAASGFPSVPATLSNYTRQNVATATAMQPPLAEVRERSSIAIASSKIQMQGNFSASNLHTNRNLESKNLSFSQSPSGSSLLCINNSFNTSQHHPILINNDFFNHATINLQAALTLAAQLQNSPSTTITHEALSCMMNYLSNVDAFLKTISHEQQLKLQQQKHQVQQYSFSESTVFNQGTIRNNTNKNISYNNCNKSHSNAPNSLYPPPPTPGALLSTHRVSDASSVMASTSPSPRGFLPRVPSPRTVSLSASPSCRLPPAPYPSPVDYFPPTSASMSCSNRQVENGDNSSNSIQLDKCNSTACSDPHRKEQVSIFPERKQILHVSQYLQQEYLHDGSSLPFCASLSKSENVNHLLDSRVSSQTVDESECKETGNLPGLEIQNEANFSFLQVPSAQNDNICAPATSKTFFSPDHVKNNPLSSSASKGNFIHRKSPQPSNNPSQLSPSPPSPCSMMSYLPPSATSIPQPSSCALHPPTCAQNQVTCFSNSLEKKESNNLRIYPSQNKVLFSVTSTDSKELFSQQTNTKEER
eukprot:GDKJ01064040.1.p1 GENE.GDKJ01064040.1~~GDKJ01064040.1.p1  ORF type:complete len:1203 (-),score=265.05 GDKJ01064040.1:649-4257(-)